MCKEYSTTAVPIPDFILNDPICCDYYANEKIYGKDGAGEFEIDELGRKCLVVDSCLVTALQALWDAGIRTTSCCCGHGSGSGVIGVATDYASHGIHLAEAHPYNLYELVERRRHENVAYYRGKHDGLVEAGREDLAMADLEIQNGVNYE